MRRYSLQQLQLRQQHESCRVTGNNRRQTTFIMLTFGVHLSRRLQRGLLLDVECWIPANAEEKRRN